MPGRIPTQSYFARNRTPLLIVGFLAGGSAFIGLKWRAVMARSEEAKRRDGNYSVLPGRSVPLGDSITASTCWRPLVWANLTRLSLTSTLQFVGSQTSDDGGCGFKLGTTDWDHRHEGHAGWRAYDIARDYLPGWLEEAQPDIIMYMLGTNDVGQQPVHTVPEIIAAHALLIEEMRRGNGEVKIIMDLLIPLLFTDDKIAAVNAGISELARQLNSTESPIYIADCNTDYPEGHWRDGIHPDDVATEWLAARISDVLIPVIEATPLIAEHPDIPQ